MTPSELLALKTEVDRLDSELGDIQTRNGDDMTSWPTGQALRYDDTTKARDNAQRSYEAGIAERQVKLDEIRTAFENPANRESGFGVNFAPNVTTRKDPWAGIGERILAGGGSLSVGDLKSRALDAIEQQSEEVPATGREYLTRLLDKARNEREASEVSEFVLSCGAPHYRSAFTKVMQDPENGSRMWTEDERVAYTRTVNVRTALSLGTGSAGYMLPLVLDPTIVLTNNGALNPWRDLAAIKTTTSNTWNGVTSAGVTAEWTTEGVEAADATPTVGQIQINAEKADAYVFGSYEVLGDTDFGNQLPALLADAKNRLEEAAFATGAGHGSNVPKGIITAVAAASKFTTGSTTNVLSSVDVFTLLAAVPDRWKANASFAMNPTVGLSLRQLGTTLGSQFWVGMGDNQPESLLGKRYRESTTMASTVATGNYIAIAGDFSQFYIVDRLGMQLVYVPAVVGTNKRPTGQAGWYAYWRVGSDVATASAFQILKVK